MGPFSGNVTADQKNWNKSMSRVRVSVEWLFGDIKSYFKFIDFKKIQLSAIGKLVTVCAILQNARTCMYGCVTSNFFNIDPPSLNNYFL